MKIFFIALCTILFPFFSIQAYFFESDYDYTTRVNKITDIHIFLDNGTVWVRNQPGDPISLNNGNTVIALINNHEYVILANRYDQIKFCECFFGGFQEGEVLRLDTLSYPDLWLSDGSRWRMPSASHIDNWRIGDAVIVMQTPNERYHQIINVKLIGREDDFVIAKIKN